MHKKLYKVVFIPFILVLLLCSSFIFISCKNKNEVQLNVFNDIVDYVKAHPVDGSTNENLVYVLSKTSNNSNNNLQKKEFLIIHNTTKNNLYFAADDGQVQFICEMKSTDDYSKNITEIATTIQYPTSNGNLSALYTAKIDLPATQYIDMQSALPLPEFKNLTENTPEEAIKVFRSQLSILLNEYFNELNDFYVQKLKGGDSTYIGAIFKYFYLPIIAVENVNF